MKTKKSQARYLINRIKGIIRNYSADPRMPQTGDIYIASYPRSGNTWIRYLLANILEPSKEWRIENINLVIPDVHQKWPSNCIVRQPRILKTHHPYRAEYQKAIYIYRDGRDVAVSYYNFAVKINSYREPFDHFLTDYLNGQVWFGAWHRHLTGWLSKKPGIEILPVKYEDLVHDPTTDFKRMCEFLNLSYSSEMIEAAIKKSSFQQIKKDYSYLKANSLASMGTAGIKGGPDLWKEVFSSDQLEQFWAIAGETATLYGYTKF